MKPMNHEQPVYWPIMVDALIIFGIVLAWHALAFAQCVPNDLTCMNLP